MGLCWTKGKSEPLLLKCECLDNGGCHDGTGGRVFLSSCNIADCDNLILQLMLMGFHCAGSLETPHTCYIAAITDEYIQDVCFTQ